MRHVTHNLSYGRSSAAVRRGFTCPPVFSGVNPDEVRRRWTEQSGEFSPTYYAYRGPNGTSEAVRAALERFLGPEPRVLELGCSSGRHLAHLHDHGHRRLNGIELNPAAFDVMADSYPELADAGTFHRESIENTLPAFGDDAFDAVFSVETLQHVHPDAAWVFKEIARVTGGLLVTAEIERGTADGDVNYVNGEFPLYYRDWGAVFGDLGFQEASVTTTQRDTVRAFRPGSA